MTKIADLYAKIGVETYGLEKAAKDLKSIGLVGENTFNKMGSAAAGNAAAFEALGAVSSSVLAELASQTRGVASAAVAGANAQKRAFEGVIATLEREIIAVDELARAERRLNNGSPARRAIVGPNFNKLIGAGGKANINWGGNGDPFNPGGAGAIWNQRGGRSHEAIQDLGIALGEHAGNKGPSATWGSFMAGAPKDNRQYVMGEGNVAGGMPAKKQGFFSRMFGGGGGGGGTAKRGGGGRGGYNARFGPLGEASAFRRVVLGAGVFQGMEWFGKLADTYTNLQSRLTNLTGSQEKATATFERLRGVAKNTNTSLETTTEAYARIKYATEDMKVSDDDVVKVISNLNTLFATSGASSDEARSAMMQLTQAFSKGKLNGDELVSMMENAPSIMKVFEKSMGKTEGQILKMAKAGKITREAMFKALLTVKNLPKPPDTFASTWQKFKDDLIVTAGRLAQNHHLVESFATILGVLADALNLVAEVLTPVIGAIGDFIQGLKDGKIWAYALAGVIGLTLIPSLISMVTWLVRILAAMKDIMLLKGMGGAVGGLKNALGMGAAEGAVTGAAGKAAAAGAAGKSGWLAKLAGGAATLLTSAGGLALGAGMIANGEVPGKSGKSYDSNTAMWQDMLKTGTYGFGSNKPLSTADRADLISKLQAQGIQAPTGGSGAVSIGNINVEIKANDMTDAQQKFSKEMLDKTMRHTFAGAGGNF